MADKTNRKRNKPAQKRYTGEKRWLKNKAKNIEKAEKRNKKGE